MKDRQRCKRGFTLVEMMVAITLFVTVVGLAASSTFIIINANRTAVKTYELSDNLALVMEDMTRNIRSGTMYHCGGGNYEEPKDCISPLAIFAFEEANGDISDDNDQVVYRRNISGKSIERSTNGGDDWQQLTGSDVEITNLRFKVTGSRSSDDEQPRVTIFIEGRSTDPKLASHTVSLQASVTQRNLDVNL